MCGTIIKKIQQKTLTWYYFKNKENFPFKIKWIFYKDFSQRLNFTKNQIYFKIMVKFEILPTSTRFLKKNKKGTKSVLF